jgi:peptide/nickel transport system permease protein
MAQYLLRRLVSAIVLIAVISVIAFVLIQAHPGDYASRYEAFAMSQGGLSAEQAEEAGDALRKRLGLDQPLPVQFALWITNIVTRGDFGQSFVYNRPVSEVIAGRFWRTLGIAITCHLLATLFGVMLGVYAAVNQYRLGDTAATVFAFLGMTIPRFFMALMILYWLAFIVGSPYIGSLYSPQYAFAPFSLAKFWDLVKHVWPVVLVATIGGLTYNLRVMRGNLLDVLRQPYIEAARAKGLPERTVVLKHAVPNALHPLVMYQGVILPYMVSGELETAIVLAIPTIGPLMLTSLQEQDIYVTASIFMMLSVILVIGNFLADILLSLLDPRIRQGAVA